MINSSSAVNNPPALQIQTKEVEKFEQLNNLIKSEIGSKNNNLQQIKMAQSPYAGQTYHEVSAFDSEAVVDKATQVLREKQPEVPQNDDYYAEFTDIGEELEIVDDNKLKPTLWDKLTGNDPNAIHSDPQNIDEVRVLINDEANIKNSSTITQQQYDDPSLLDRFLGNNNHYDQKYDEEFNPQGKTSGFLFGTSTISKEEYENESYGNQW